MKKLLIFLLIISPLSLAEDYKTAIRLQEGDVISADVINDILDRIGSNLITVKSSDLLGTWDLVQTTTANGNIFNGNSGTLTGGSAPVDSLYRQRVDTVVFSDDGDGTYSLQTSDYCGFLPDPQEGSPCALNFALIDGRFLLGFSGANIAYVAEKRSDTRIILSEWASASSSFNLIRLDKKFIPPAVPTSLSATNTGGVISLAWEAGDDAATSYKVMSRDSVEEEYSELVTEQTSTTYTDSLSSGITRWYRVFAINENGVSVGSNVVNVTVE